MFITFEGGEGSGKTSQINRLSEYLNVLGHKVVSTREPGGTPEAEKIRDFLVKRDGGAWSPAAEVLLLYAARVMHVEHVITPALVRDKIVVCDRFSDSTLAYQGYGHGYDLDAIKQLDALMLSDVKPDLTIILDIPAQEGIERSTRRLAGEALGFDREEDRFERLDIEFHEKLRQGFLDIAAQESERCVVLDAGQSIDAVAAKVREIIDDRLAKAEKKPAA